MFLTAQPGTNRAKSLYQTDPLIAGVSCLEAGWGGQGGCFVPRLSKAQEMCEHALRQLRTLCPSRSSHVWLPDAEGGHPSERTLSQPPSRCTCADASKAYSTLPARAPHGEPSPWLNFRESGKKVQLFLEEGSKTAEIVDGTLGFTGMPRPGSWPVSCTRCVVGL